MSQSNEERAYSELMRLDGRLRPFIIRQMSHLYGASWQQEALKSLHNPKWTTSGDLHLDFAASLYVLRDQWERIFHQQLRPVEREIFRELLRARISVSHQWSISDTKLERVQKNVEHLLTWIGPIDSFSQPTFTQTRTTRSNPRPSNQAPPHWQDLRSSPRPARTSFLRLLEDKLLGLPNSPRPARTPGQPIVSRRTILLLALAAAGGVSIFLCEQSLQAMQPYQPGPNQTGTPQEPTTTSLSQPLFTYKGHPKAVNAVAWSPDGKRIASGSDDTTVQVWNASDGSHIFTYHGHSNGVDAVAWSPDGKRIASGSQDDTVQVWNASDGSHIFTYTRHSSKVTSVAWSPDGQHIASGSWDQTVRVWNASDGSDVIPPFTGHSDNVLAVTWSPDGKRIASGSQDNTVQVWQAAV